MSHQAYADQPDPELAEDTLLVYAEPVEVEPPENRESFLRESGFGTRRKTQLPPLDTKPSIRDILDAIFPARRSELEGHFFERHVSTQDALRDDLKDLENKLELKLRERQARYN